MVVEGSSTICVETLIVSSVEFIMLTVSEGRAVGRGLAVTMEYAVSSLPARTTGGTLCLTMGLTVW